MNSRDESSIAFVLELGRALHAYGTPAHRLEDALGTIGKRLGLNLNIFSTPTSIMVSFGPSQRQHTSLLRVEPGDVDLEKLADVDRLAQDVECGRIDPAEGLEQLRRIVERPARYGSFATTAAFALVSASAARFFGGGLAEIALAFGVGLMIGCLALLLSRTQRGGRIFPLVAAFSAMVASGLFARFVTPVSTYVATLAGLIVLIPGLTLTIAMNELATRNLVSGSSRLTAAGIVFLEIAFGVALGERVVQHAGTLDLVTPTTLPFWTEIPALLVAALALTVLFRARPWGLPHILGACMLSIWGARGGSWLLGPELSMDDLADKVLERFGLRVHPRSIGRARKRGEKKRPNPGSRGRVEPGVDAEIRGSATSCHRWRRGRADRSERVAQAGHVGMDRARRQRSDTVEPSPAHLSPLSP